MRTSTSQEGWSTRWVSAQRVKGEPDNSDGELQGMTERKGGSQMKRRMPVRWEIEQCHVIIHIMTPPLFSSLLLTTIT